MMNVVRRFSATARSDPLERSVGLKRPKTRALNRDGSLCGHCSRDLPLDRRLLFVAELTGYEMVGVVGNAPTWPFTGNCFTDSSRSLRDYTPMKNGSGTWTRTTINKLMRL